MGVSVKSSTCQLKKDVNVAKVEYSRLAEADFLEIGDYTLRTWGEVQADKYIDQLERCFHRVAEHPAMGRSCGDAGPGLRRIEEGKHVVFYRRQAQGILVLRILHKSMLPERHLIFEGRLPRSRKSKSDCDTPGAGIAS